MQTIKTCVLVFFLLFITSCENSMQERISQKRKIKKRKNIQKTEKVFLFLGDSLTAGKGVEKEEAFPSLIGEKMKKAGYPYKVKNGGISGYTSADVLSNLDWYLTNNVHIVFLAIGANDGLRGHKIQNTTKNIVAIIQQCKKRNITIILAGMKLPPNYGSKYTKSFENMYKQIALRFQLKCMPFLLKDVGGETKYNQADGIHPNQKGHKIIANNVFQFFIEENILP